MRIFQPLLDTCFGSSAALRLDGRVSPLLPTLLIKAEVSLSVKHAEVSVYNLPSKKRQKPKDFFG